METTSDSFQGGQEFRDRPHTLHPEDSEIQTSTRRWRRPHVAREPLMISKRSRLSVFKKISSSRS
jgi:hypothetical protein